MNWGVSTEPLRCMVGTLTAVSRRLSDLERFFIERQLGMRCLSSTLNGPHLDHGRVRPKEAALRPTTATARITLVHSPACHFCDDASQALEQLAHHAPVEVLTVEVDSPEGEALVTQHRPAMNPLILVDGEYFSSGRLPRKKLARLLDDRYGIDASAAWSR